MPVSGLLKAVGHGQQAAFVEVIAYDLQPDGQRAFGAAKAARHGHGGQACQAYTQGVDVRSEEHTSELQSLMRISYAVFCLKKKKIIRKNNKMTNRRQILLRTKRQTEIDKMKN